MFFRNGMGRRRGGADLGRRVRTSPVTCTSTLTSSECVRVAHTHAPCTHARTHARTHAPTHPPTLSHALTLYRQRWPQLITRIQPPVRGRRRHNLIRLSVRSCQSLAVSLTNRIHLRLRHARRHPHAFPARGRMDAFHSFRPPLSVGITAAKERSQPVWGRRCAGRAHALQPQSIAFPYRL